MCFEQPDIYLYMKIITQYVNYLKQFYEKSHKFI